MQILNWHLYLQIDVCIQYPVHLFIQTCRAIGSNALNSEARELPVDGKVKTHFKKVSSQKHSEPRVSEAHVADMNVDLSRSSCLYSDPSVYVKTEYEATGKVDFKIENLVWW